MKRRLAFLLTAAALVSAVVVIAYLARPDRQPVAERAELHADDAVRRLARHDIAATTKDARSPLDVPCLDVVPNGSTRTRREVFKALGLDEGRVRDFRMTPVDHVVFLRWQVSASYDVVCMTGDDAWNPEAVPLADPERPVYGIRLLSRTEGSHLFW